MLTPLPLKHRASEQLAASCSLLPHSTGLHLQHRAANLNEKQRQMLLAAMLRYSIDRIALQRRTSFRVTLALLPWLAMCCRRQDRAGRIEDERRRTEREVADRERLARLKCRPGPGGILAPVPTCAPASAAQLALARLLVPRPFVPRPLSCADRLPCIQKRRRRKRDRGWKKGPLSSRCPLHFLPELCLPSPLLSIPLSESHPFTALWDRRSHAGQGSTYRPADGGAQQAAPIAGGTYCRRQGTYCTAPKPKGPFSNHLLALCPAPQCLPASYFHTSPPPTRHFSSSHPFALEASWSRYLPPDPVPPLQERTFDTWVASAPRLDDLRRVLRPADDV
jgi:hypothetical protein